MRPYRVFLVYLQQNKKKAKAEGKKCHAKTVSPPFFFPLFFSGIQNQMKMVDCMAG
jgi:hypothetical protein